MTKVWSRSGFQEKVLDAQEVSRSPRCIVTKYVLNDRTIVAGKSNSPQRGRRTAGLVGESFYKPSRFYYQKDKNIHEALATTELLPKPLGVIPEDLELIMEWAEGTPFFRQIIKVEKELASGTATETRRYVQIDRLNRKLLDHLVGFYDKSADFSQNMVSKTLLALTNGDYKRRRKKEFFLEMRSSYEEEVRLRSALLKLVYSYCRDFKNLHPQFYVLNMAMEPNQRRDIWSKGKEAMKSYLHTKGFNYNEKVKEFLSAYNCLIYDEPDADLITLLKEGKILTIHGDWGPHNVKYIKGKYGKILDTNETRLGNPHRDVITGVNNFWSRPSESRIPGLVETAWQELLNIHGSYEDYPDFFAGCIATRIYDNLRIAAINSTYSDEDIDRFVEDYPPFDGLNRPDKNQKFKSDRLDDSTKVITHYTLDDGRNIIARATPRKQEAFARLMGVVDDFLHVTKITAPVTEKYRGKPYDQLGAFDGK